MWVIKSIGLGLLTVLAALFALIACILIALFALAARQSEGEGVGWDVVSLTRQHPLVPVVFVALVCLLFVTGFGYGYRRYYPRY